MKYNDMTTFEAWQKQTRFLKDEESIQTKTTVKENQRWTEFKQLKTDFIQKNYCTRGKEALVYNWAQF